MANNYLSFSEMVENLNEQEKAWWEKELEVPEFQSDEDGDENLARWLEDRGLEDECEWPGFEYQFENYQGKCGLWFYTEEYGNLENLANMMQGFLAEFRPKDYFHASWSETCSKPRLGEFGGGAVFVTADDQKWVSSYGFINECMREFNGKTI